MQGRRIGNLFFLRKKRDLTFGELYKVANVENHKITSFYLGYLIDEELPIKTKYLEERIESLKKHRVKGITVENSVVEIGKKKLLLTDYIHAYSLDEIIKISAEKNMPINLEIGLTIVRSIVDENLLVKEHYGSEGKEIHLLILPDQIFIDHEGVVSTLFPSLVLSELITKPSKQIEFISKAMFSFLFPKDYSGEITKNTELYYYSSMLLCLITGGAHVDERTKFDKDYIKNNFKLSVPFNESKEIPDFIVDIVLKGLKGEYKNLDEFFKDIEDIFERGDVQPTTYNLAFYINTLLREEIYKEKEQHKKDYLSDVPEEEKIIEEKTDKLYKEIEKEVEMELEKEKSSLPIFVGIGVAIVVIVGVLFFVTGGKKEKPKPQQLQKVVEKKPAIDIEKLKAEIEKSLSQKYEEKMKEIEKKYEDQIKQIKEEALRKKLEEEKRKQLEELRKQQEIEKQKQLLEAQKIAEEQVKKAEENEQKKKEVKQEEQKQQQEATAPSLKKPEEEEKVEEEKKEPEKPKVEKGAVYPIKELDSQVKVLKWIDKITVPPSVRARTSQLRIIATILVNEEGVPEKINIISVIPNYPGIKKRVAKALQNVRFTKPTKEGVPVKTWKSLNFVIKTGR